MIEKYEQLSEFLGCYLHQDWKIRAKTEIDAVELYVKEFHSSMVDECLSEIDQIIQEIDSNNLDADSILLKDFHVGYYYPNYGFNGYDWLNHLKSLIIDARETVEIKT